VPGIFTFSKGRLKLSPISSNVKGCSCPKPMNIKDLLINNCSFTRIRQVKISPIFKFAFKKTSFILGGEAYKKAGRMEIIIQF